MRTGISYNGITTYADMDNETMHYLIGARNEMRENDIEYRRNGCYPLSYWPLDGLDRYEFYINADMMDMWKFNKIHRLPRELHKEDFFFVFKDYDDKIGMVVNWKGRGLKLSDDTICSMNGVRMRERMCVSDAESDIMWMCIGSFKIRQLSSIDMKIICDEDGFII